MAYIATTLTGMEEARRNRGWLLALGIGLLVLGLMASSTLVATTFATIYFLGILLLIGGAMEIMNAFRHGAYGGFWMHLFVGILDMVVGALLLAFPASGAAALTLILAIFLLVGGLMRTTTGIISDLPKRGWAIVSGLVDFVLGLMLLASWPVSALWFLGLAVGIALIFRGIWWMAFSFSLGKPTPEPVQ